MTQLSRRHRLAVALHCCRLAAADGLAALFYREDIEHHFAQLQAYAEPELDGTEWTAADSAARIRQLHDGNVFS